MPTISETTVNPMIVPAGNTISPFHDVTISDSGANSLDSATLTVTGGGTLSGAGLTPGAPGVYTTTALSPSQLTDIVSKAIFTPPPLGGQPSVETNIRLDVTDSGGVVSITTTITEIAPPPPPPGGNFTITDQTTDQQTFASGDPYIGPVAGIDWELIHITPDNINITSHKPNSFIHTGDGQDGIDVSAAGGNNIIDAGTNSNFLTGGSGNDTFYLDDRNPTSNIWSTIQNFHLGDHATIWGVTADDFKLTWLQDQGADGARGLTGVFEEDGQPKVAITLAGFGFAGLRDNTIRIEYGRTSDLPGLPGSNFATIALAESPFAPTS